MSNVKPTPEGYHSVTPYLFIKGAARAIDFYKNVFGAAEVVRMAAPNGQIMHAELKIGDSMIMMSDENPQIGALSPLSIGGTASGLHLYVPDVDAVIEKAVAAGAKPVRPVQDQDFAFDVSGVLRVRLVMLESYLEQSAPCKVGMPDKKRVVARIAHRNHL